MWLALFSEHHQFGLGRNEIGSISTTTCSNLKFFVGGSEVLYLHPMLLPASAIMLYSDAPHRFSSTVPHECLLVRINIFQYKLILFIAAFMHVFSSYSLLIVNRSKHSPNLTSTLRGLSIMPFMPKQSGVSSSQPFRAKCYSLFVDAHS